MNASRASIYYWKCDRPAAFHGVFRSKETAAPGLLTQLTALLSEALDGPVTITPAGGKGNHRTFLVDHAGERNFARVEDGPEGDDNLNVESQILIEVGRTGVPVPRVIFTDASRTRVPYAVQLIEYFECSDLNSAYQKGELALVQVAAKIGRNIARWQNVPVCGFGPFDPVRSRVSGKLTGYHNSYETYFQLHLDRHLALLTANGLLSESESRQIKLLLTEEKGPSPIKNAVLVHKDLALWNIMGTANEVRAFIDWDDAIAGDPMDDLSLLGCFYSGEVIQSAFDGYASERPLPDGHLHHFWRHLLRNMIVKAVIRCGAGYFTNGASGAFLMDPGQDGPAFKRFTREKLLSALRGLTEARALTDL